MSQAHKPEATPYSRLKIFHHEELIKKLGTGQRCAPLRIRIKPTNRCNHNCTFCHYLNPYLTLDHFKPDDFIDRERMLSTLRSIQKAGTKAIVFSGGGEPLLYPYMEDSVELAKSLGLEYALITNGTLLKGRLAELFAEAKWVRISINSVRDEVYCKSRDIKAGEFTKLCSVIESFGKQKKSGCELGINFVIGPENYAEIIEAGLLLKSLGVNHIKFSAQFSNTFQEDHAPFKDEALQQLAELKQEQTEAFKIINLYEGDLQAHGTCATFRRSYSHCYAKEFSCVIGADSRVYFCHDKAYLKDGVAFDLKDGSFHELWAAPEILQKYQAFQADQVCPHHCTYDELNALLHAFFGIKKEHINFI